MFEYLTLANARLMVGMNEMVAGSPSIYMLALFLTDKFSDLLTLGTFALMWFWPRLNGRTYLSRYGQQAAGYSRGIYLKFWREWAGKLTREESRAQFIVLCLAGMAGYVTVRLIAFQMDAPRPFASYLPIHAGVPGAFKDLRTFGSFPSDHAVLLAALPVALRHWDKTLAWVWAGLAVVLAVTRIAVGFHSPADMVAGALVGAIFAHVSMSWYEKGGKFKRGMHILARGFELSAAPYCYFLYGLAFAGALEFAMHFQHVLQLIFTLNSELMVRFFGGR